MKAVSYLRVSTDEQANEGHSLDAQRAIVGDFCLSRNWTLVGEYLYPARTVTALPYRSSWPTPGPTSSTWSSCTPWTASTATCKGCSVPSTG